MIVKSTGIVRKVDELGRIVLPIELRRTLDISEKDALEIYKKYLADEEAKKEEEEKKEDLP